MENLEFNYIEFYTELITTNGYISIKHFNKLEELPIIKEWESELIQDMGGANEVREKILYKFAKLNFLDKNFAYNNKNTSIKEHMQDIIVSDDNKKGEELWKNLKESPRLFF